MESNKGSSGRVYPDGHRVIITPLHIAYFCKLSLAEVENMKMKRV